MEAQTRRVIIKEVPKVWTPDSAISITGEDEDLTFVCPAFGSDTYENVGSQIDDAGLARPTSKQTIQLVHPAYFDDNFKESQEAGSIRETIEQRLIWEFTRNLWTPEGVYLYDDATGELRDRKYLENQLGSREEKRVVYSDDGSVRFVPKGFKLAGQTSRELVNNNYIIARYGEDGAELIAELSEKFSRNPSLFGLEDFYEDDQRFSALGCNWTYDGIIVYSDSVGGLNGGALGVMRAA